MPCNLVDGYQKTDSCHLLGGFQTEGSRFLRNVGTHPPKLHGVTSHKTILQIFTAVRISNPTTSLFHNFSFRIYEATWFENTHLDSF
jgi:hypothetical protein